MGMKELRIDLDEEVSTILASDFSVSVTRTDTVPHSGDGAITFPNLDTKTQGAKLIETAVLYIDIRRSTVLNLSHRPQTVAKLYSAFVRAMTQVARFQKGHVRGIIGDRVMVIFDRAGAHANAVECAISMNTVSKYIINKHFRANEIACGIGIDYGRMLATKTGIRRHGAEQGNYRNLVWLGSPANVASKLTDLANKPGERLEGTKVCVAYRRPPGALSSLLIGAPAAPWEWREEWPSDFVQNLEVKYAPTRIEHASPNFESFYTLPVTLEIRPSTPPILMTKAVWDGYKAAKPNDAAVKRMMFDRVEIEASAYNGEIYGGDVIYPALKE